MTDFRNGKSCDPRPLSPPVRDQLNQKGRLAALAELEFSKPDTDAIFRGLVKEAVALFDAQVAQINLLDNERRFTICGVGSDVLEKPVEETFCAHALSEATPAMVILDTHHDERFADIPFVSGGPKARFYIGCPIRFRNHKVGTLCVLDSEPREIITPDQKRLLIELAWDAEQILTAHAGKQHDSA